MFSQSCKYAFQALLVIAAAPRWQPVRLSAIVQQCSAPYHYLKKVLQKLVKAGILTSQKGPNGGFLLAKPASEITLLNVINAINNADSSTECLLGLTYCRKSRPCPMHQVKESMQRVLAHCTLEEMRDGVAA